MIVRERETSRLQLRVVASDAMLLNKRRDRLLKGRFGWTAILGRSLALTKREASRGQAAKSNTCRGPGKQAFGQESCLRHAATELN